MHYKLKEQYISTIKPKKITSFTISVYGQTYNGGNLVHKLLVDDSVLSSAKSSRPSFKIGLLFKKK